MSTTQITEDTESILMFWLGALGVLGGEQGETIEGNSRNIRPR